MVELEEIKTNDGADLDGTKLNVASRGDRDHARIHRYLLPKLLLLLPDGYEKSKVQDPSMIHMINLHLGRRRFLHMIEYSDLLAWNYHRP